MEIKRIIYLVVILLAASQASASDCNKHPRPGCPDNIVNNTFITNEINSAVALSAAIPDLLPDPGNSRIDFALSNYADRNAVGTTFMHSWDSKGTVWENTSVKETSLGFSAATGEGDGNNWLLRVQGGFEW